MTSFHSGLCQWHGCAMGAVSQVLLTDYVKPDVRLLVCELHVTDAVEHMDRLKRSTRRGKGAVLVGPFLPLEWR